MARMDSLALKLLLRPNMQELINRNILQMGSEEDRLEMKQAIGVRLTR